MDIFQLRFIPTSVIRHRANRGKKHKVYQRLSALRLLHERIEICLKPLAEIAHSEHANQTISGTYIHHPVRTLYVPDIPKTEDLSVIKREGQTKNLFYKCYGHKRKAAATFSFYEDKHRKTPKVDEKRCQDATNCKGARTIFF